MFPIRAPVPAAVPVIPSPPPVIVGHIQFVSVGNANFDEQMNLIAALLPRYPYIAIDTEYPGTVHGAPVGTSLTAADRYYALVKANVDELPVLQLGLTISDEDGNLPASAIAAVDGGLPPPLQMAWVFHFSDFDAARHRYSGESARFLTGQGFDFAAARAHGVPAARFAGKLAAVLAALPPGSPSPAWVAFGGAFDFAHLVKMLSGGLPLPATRAEFVKRAKFLLRGPVLDAKFMAEHCGPAQELCAGSSLGAVADILGVPQLEPPPPSLAGPKSYTASCIFKMMRMRTLLVYGGTGGFDGLIDGFVDIN